MKITQTSTSKGKEWEPEEYAFKLKHSLYKPSIVKVRVVLVHSAEGRHRQTSR